MRKSQNLLSILVLIWVMILAFFIREYAILNHLSDGTSYLTKLGRLGFLDLKVDTPTLDPKPGGPLSFKLGWIGFSIICLTNFYILRKRWPLMHNFGHVGNWLDFHIFFGLLGTTLICFHTNFKITGLASISFICMWVSFLSGVVGRYFYLQIVHGRSEIQSRLIEYEKRFQKLSQVGGEDFSVQHLSELKNEMFYKAGGSEAMASGRLDLLGVFISSVLGDIKLFLWKIGSSPSGVEKSLRKRLVDYALLRRRLISVTYYQRIMGYWHSFHLPFAIFMYLVTIIHIASALIFRVDH